MIGGGPGSSGIEGWRPVSAPVMNFGSAAYRDAPPPLPPRIQSPPPNNGGSNGNAGCGGLSALNGSIGRPR